MPPPAQVPDVQLVAVAAPHEDLRVYPILEHVRRAPLDADHGVKGQVPPEMVGKRLRTASYLPAPQGLNGLVIHDEDTPRPVAVRGTQRAYVEAVGAAVDGVRAAVARALVQLLGLYHLHDLRLRRIWLGVDDVDA